MRESLILQTSERAESNPESHHFQKIRPIPSTVLLRASIDSRSVLRTDEFVVQIPGKLRNNRVAPVFLCIYQEEKTAACTRNGNVPALLTFQMMSAQQKHRIKCLALCMVDGCEDYTG